MIHIIRVVVERVARPNWFRVEFEIVNEKRVEYGKRGKDKYVEEMQESWQIVPFCAQVIFRERVVYQIGLLGWANKEQDMIVRRVVEQLVDLYARRFVGIMSCRVVRRFFIFSL